MTKSGRRFPVQTAEDPDTFYKSLIDLGIQEEDLHGNPVYRDDDGNVIPQERESSEKLTTSRDVTVAPDKVPARIALGRNRTRSRRR